MFISVMMFFLVHGVFAQTVTSSADMDLSITFVYPSPVCTLSGRRSLYLGSVERPSSGTNSASGDLYVDLSGTHVSGWTATAGLPTSLTSGSNSVNVTSTWAQSTPSQRFTDIVGRTYRGTAGGLGTEFEHEFRFTSEAEVLNSTPTGRYTGNITFEVTCSP